jgi:beta-galactosidase
VNGRSLGTRADCRDKICVWEKVRLAPGADSLVAIGRFASGPVEDRIEWRLAESQARSFRIDSGTILAASAAAGRFGSDAFFEGGSAGTADTVRRGRPPVLAAITGSPDRDLLASYREGAFRYRVPVGEGRFRITLAFVEPSAAPGERQFDVAIGGERVLSGFDVAAAAGAKLSAVTRSFSAQSKGGMIDLSFAPVKGKAIVSALTIEPE